MSAELLTKKKNLTPKFNWQNLPAHPRPDPPALEVGARVLIGYSGRLVAGFGYFTYLSKRIIDEGIVASNIASVDYVWPPITAC